MHKWLLLVLAVLVAVAAVGCKQGTHTSSQASPNPASNQTALTEDAASCSESCSPSTVEGETVKLTFRLPEEALKPEAPLTPGAPRAGSPNLHVAELLGVRVGGQGVCVFSQVNEGGLADQAGIKVGDVIVNCNGGEPDCASALDSWLYCGKEPGLVEMTLKRPSAEGASSSKNPSSTSSKQSSPTGG